MKKLLMIGINENILNALGSSDWVQIYAIEEEELFNMRYKSSTPIGICEVRFGEYQQSIQCVEIAKKWSETTDFDAVMPGREYAVFACNEVAKALGLKRIGDDGARCLTNKFELRTAISQIKGIGQPSFKKITSLKDLNSFYTGSPIVVKPSNRQSSVGVLRVYKKEDLERAWSELTSCAEKGQVITGREMKWQYQAECMMEGQEYSVESLVSDGDVLFQNITKKTTTMGKYSVELGHEVPAPLDLCVRKKFLDSQHKLIKGLNISTAAIHSEWILEDGTPKLIECAGRAPGDYIPKLIDIAYDFSYYQAFAKILLGEKTIFPRINTGYSAIVYFQGAPGRVLDISGYNEIKKMKGFILGRLSFDVGELIPELKDSWSRAGFVILRANVRIELEQMIEKVKITKVYNIEK